MIGIDYADTYDPDTDFDRYYTIATSRAIAARINSGDDVLELGCATGLMTSEIVHRSHPASWLGLDRSASFLARASRRELPGTRFGQADLDVTDSVVATFGADAGTSDAAKAGNFQHILLTNVLHEVADPGLLLRACGEWLALDGLIHVTLQNPHSIHRLCAYELGMVSSLTEISDRGALWGTRGLWTADQLTELAASASLRVVAREGIMVKPLPNNLMSELPEDVLEGFIRAAVHMPGLCAMNYLVLGNDCTS